MDTPPCCWYEHVLFPVEMLEFFLLVALAKQTWGIHWVFKETTVIKMQEILFIVILFLTAAYGNTDSLHLLIDSGERVDITDVMDIHGQ